MNLAKVNLAKEVSVYSEWYWDGLIDVDTYYALCDAAIILFQMGE